MATYKETGKTFYVYAYLRHDGSPYYIGKGSDNRLFSKGKGEVRPPKDRSFIVIVENNLTDVGALAIERRLVRWYGRKDNGTGILRNKTDGGDGAAGIVRSEEFRKAQSERSKGRKYGPQTPERIEARVSQYRGKKPTPEVIEKRAAPRRGVPLTIEHKEKLKVAKTGVPRSKESCIKQSATMTGRKRPEHSAVMMGKSRPTVTCPHCNKTGGINNMSRWHFDNCREKNDMAAGPKGE